MKGNKILLTLIGCTALSVCGPIAFAAGDHSHSGGQAKHTEDAVKICKKCGAEVKAGEHHSHDGDDHHAHGSKGKSKWKGRKVSVRKVAMPFSAMTLGMRHYNSADANLFDGDSSKQNMFMTRSRADRGKVLFFIGPHCNTGATCVDYVSSIAKTLNVAIDKYGHGKIQAAVIFVIDAYQNMPDKAVKGMLGKVMSLYCLDNVRLGYMDKKNFDHCCVLSYYEFDAVRDCNVGYWFCNQRLVDSVRNGKLGWNYLTKDIMAKTEHLAYICCCKKKDPCKKKKSGCCPGNFTCSDKPMCPPRKEHPKCDESYFPAPKKKCCPEPCDPDPCDGCN